MFSRLVPIDSPDALALRLEAWVSEHFRLPPAATVQVLEQAGDSPGSPACETVIAFWTDAPDGGTVRHHTKVFKPLAEVQPGDLPPWWMKDALAVPAGWACDCC
jgi:hypothetical protein